MRVLKARENKARLSPRRTNYVLTQTSVFDFHVINFAKHFFFRALPTSYLWQSNLFPVFDQHFIFKLLERTLIIDKRIKVYSTLSFTIL